MPCFSVFPQFYRLTSLSICSILFHTQSIQYIFICLRVSNKSVWLELLNLQEFLRASLIISADMGGKKINSGRLKMTENTFPAEKERKGIQTAEIWAETSHTTEKRSMMKTNYGNGGLIIWPSTGFTFVPLSMCWSQLTRHQPWSEINFWGEEFKRRMWREI